jgi:hypothetical protein
MAGCGYGMLVKVIDQTYGHLVRGAFDRVRAALKERAHREAGTDATPTTESPNL